MFDKPVPEDEIRLRDEYGLAFVTQRTLKARGGHKTIYAVKSRSRCQDCSAIHSSHGVETALKRYSSSMQKSFLRETRMLRHVQPIRHQHIISIIASYENADGLFIMLPLGESNLYEFWTRTDPRSDLRGYEMWFADQVVGLVDALRVMHQISRPADTRELPHTTHTMSSPLGIIHGDIHPGNLVVFPNGGTAKPKLKLADLEMSLWHDEVPTGFPIRTYEAPEIPLDNIITDRSDIWSLGCVLVEFATWLVGGPSAIVDIGQRRHMRTAGSNTPWLKDDRFFQLEYEDKRIVGAKIKHVIVEVVQDLLREERCATMIQHILAVVMADMLPMRPECRKSAAELAEELANTINTFAESVS